MRGRLMTCAAALAMTLGAAGAASAQTYSRIVVFGDSLTDNGNLFRLSGGTNPASPPYTNGRFSTGPVFVELLGFGAINGFGTVTGNTDYAFGGARTDLSASPPGMRAQLATYLGAGGRFGRNDLVVVYGGANNIFQGIQALPFAGAAANANPVGYITGITNGAAVDLGLIINSVAGAGAGTILVPNLPSLGATPQFNGFLPLNAPAGPLAEAATGALNASVLAQVNTASALAANAGTNFIYMDVNRLDSYIRANPGAFGYTNVTSPCLNLTTGAVCANPDQFLYFDTVHPTAAGHRGLAQLTNEYLYYGSRGAATTALGETALLNREAAQDAVLARLDDARDGEGVRFTLALEGGNSSDGVRGVVPEIDRDTGSIRVGVDGALGSGLVIGAQAHASHSDVDAGAMNFEADSLGLDGFVGVERGSVFVNLVAGASADEYSDYRRATGVGPVFNFADRVTGSSYGAKLQGGFRIPLGGAELSPRAAISGMKTTVDAFTETGPSARHALREHEIEAVAGEASLRLDTPLGGGRFQGHVEGGYGDFLGYDGEVAVGLAENPARVLVTDVEEPGRGALLNAGLAGELFAGVRLGVSYRGRFGDDHDSHAALLTVSVRR